MTMLAQRNMNHRGAFKMLLNSVSAKSGQVQFTAEIPYRYETDDHHFSESSYINSLLSHKKLGGKKKCY